MPESMPHDMPDPMTGLADPARVAGEAARVFEALGLDYLVGGSLASTLYGEPRGTFDVDFAANVPSARADDLAAGLSRDFLVDPESVREAASTKRMFNAIHARLYVKLDVHVRAVEGHFAAELARAKVITLAPGLQARFATAEDVLVKKLWWYRKGDGASDRQWRDVLGILRSMGARLDLDHCRHWSKTLGTLDLLERALDEVARER